MRAFKVSHLEKKWDWALIIVGRLISVASTVLTSVLIARFLGPVSQGRIVSILTFILIFSTVLSMSIDQTFIAKVSSLNSLRSIASNSYVIILFSFLLGFIGIMLSFLFFPSFLGLNLLESLLFCIIFLATLINTISISLFLIAGRIYIYLFIIVSQTFSILCSLLLLVWLGKLSISFTLVIYALNSFISAFFSLLLSKPSFKILSKTLQKQLLVDGLKLHLGTLARFLHFRIDVIFLALFTDFRTVAVYSVAVSFVEFLFVFTDSLANSKLRSIATSVLADAYRVSQKLVVKGLFLGCVYCFGLVLLGKLLIEFLYGAEYLDSSKIIFYLLPGILILAISRGTFAYCTRINSPIHMNLISILSLTVNVGLNLVLIPEFGAIGAAISSSFSYSFLGLSYLIWFYLSRKETSIASIPRFS